MQRVLRGSLVLAVLLSVSSSSFGQIVFGPDLDPNVNGLVFNQSDLYNFGSYGLDDTAVETNPGFLDNDMAVIVAFAPGTSNDGAGYVSRVSNGENMNDGDDPMNPDLPNIEPANPIFSFNPSGRLENGNVIRYSQWLKLDPAAPVLTEPGVEPIMKIEFWTEALSGDADFSSLPNPARGDRIFDTDQNGEGLLATYIDLTGDGDSANPLFLPPDFSLDSGEWTLVSTQYTVDDTNWGYLNPNGNGFVQKTVADVEDIRASMFVGDFFGTDLTDGGAFWLDNPMIEIYQSISDVPATIPNPNPLIPISGCDFNNDTSCDAADIDLLTAETASGGNDPMFDLTGDNLVNGADIAEWLVQAGADPGNAAATGGNPFLAGDANLDGVVDGQDFIVWNGAKFSSSDQYSMGDFNGDGVVDGQDFIVWNSNKFQASSGDIASVPEPSAIGMLLLGVLGLARRRFA